MFHDKTKHIKINYHFVKDTEKEEKVNLLPCRSNEQMTKIFMKGLSRFKFATLRFMLGAFSKNVKEL